MNGLIEALEKLLEKGIVIEPVATDAWRTGAWRVRSQTDAEQQQAAQQRVGAESRRAGRTW